MADPFDRLAPQPPQSDEPRSKNTWMRHRIGNQTERMQFSHIRQARRAPQHCIAQYGMKIVPIKATHIHENAVPNDHAYACQSVFRPYRLGKQKNNTSKTEVGQKYPSHSLYVYSLAYINPCHHGDDCMLITEKPDANLNIQ